MSAIGALPLTSFQSDLALGPSIPSAPVSATGGLAATITDLATAAQLGLGIYNETQGGPAINLTGAKAGTPVVATTFLGFSIPQIVIGLVLIVGIFLVVHYTTR